MSIETTCGMWKGEERMMFQIKGEERMMFQIKGEERIMFQIKGEERMMFQIKAKSICPTHKSYLVKSALKNQPKYFSKNLNDLWAHQGQ